MIQLLTALLLLTNVWGQSAPFSHDGFDRVLSRRVAEAGRVDYAGLKADRADLDAYVDSLGQTSPKSAPDRFPTRADALAYWINAYNALALTGVIDAYPTKSVKDIKMLSGFFNRTWYTVGGKLLTLNNIEHDIIREEFKDPRIHAAINCASIGCPRLESQVFTGGDLDTRLEAAMRAFLNDARHVKVDPQNRTVTLSKILDWFESDFTDWYESKFRVDASSIVDYVALYVDEAKVAREWDVKYEDYDWMLNDQATADGGR